MGLGRKSLFLLSSVAIHGIALGAFLWHGTHRRETISVEPGRSSIKMISLEGRKAQPRVEPAIPDEAPPPRDTKPAPPHTPKSDRRETKLREEPASIRETGALTPSQPDVRRNTPPAYPEEARRRGIEGTTMLLVRVGRDGEAKEVTLSSGSGSALLDEAAVAAVRRWHFRPAFIGALPVESLVEVPIRFRLDR